MEQDREQEQERREWELSKQAGAKGNEKWKAIGATEEGTPDSAVDGRTDSLYSTKGHVSRAGGRRYGQVSTVPNMVSTLTIPQP